MCTERGSVSGCTAASVKEVSTRLSAMKGTATRLRRVSTPGLRRYVGVTEIPRVRNGLGVAILSTSSGLMSDAQARRAHTGGELLALVW